MPSSRSKRAITPFASVFTIATPYHLLGALPMADLATRLVHLVVREANTCDTGNEFDGRIGTRISAIFVILAGSFLGIFFTSILSNVN